MATIKSFTDLGQLKKLAEILPIESADLCYDRCGTPVLIDKIVTHESIENDKYGHLIPCWSLAALLDVIPEGIIENYYCSNLQKENGKYSIAYGDEELLCIADNPVDACCEMILKLHEQNLL